MTPYKHGTRPTVGVLAGWQFYEGNVDGFLEVTLRGIHLEAQKRNCNLLFACGLGHAIGPIQDCPAWPVGSAETDFVPVGPWNTDGLIVINPLLTDARGRYIQQVRKEGHPVVFVGSGTDGMRVVADNESGIRQAVAHLAQHGHRRVAFIAGHKDELDEDSNTRLHAYQAAVREFGLDDDPALIVYGLHSSMGGDLAMRKLLESGTPFRAVVTSNDPSAFGVIRALHRAGLRIPQDVAIISFDDLPGADCQEPPLTAVHYPLIGTGKTALALLLDAINGDSLNDIETVKVPVHLVVRESCGCRPGASIAVIPPGQPGEESTVAQQMARSMAETIGQEARFLASQEIKTLCEQLVLAFISSLKGNDPAVFQTMFVSVLRRAEELNDDPSLWHSAISLLQQNVSCLPIFPNTLSTGKVEAMLHQARVDISMSMRKRHWQHTTTRGLNADQVGLLSLHLFAAVENGQIFEALRKFLPLIGIGRTDIGFYEAEKDDLEAWSHLYQVSKPDPAPVRFPSRQFPPDGFDRDRPNSLAVFPLHNQGKVDGFIAFDSLDLGICVTVVRQLNAAFRSVRLYQEAVEGRRLAEEADNMKSRFLSTVSHELRTPLNLIVGLSNLVLQEETTEPSAPRQRDLEQIHTSAEHLGRLIRDVLDLATSQAGQLRLDLESFNLVEALGAALEAGEELTRQKGLEWQVSLPDERPLVMGDRTRLRQVLLNLVSNAVKFTESGRVAVKIEMHEREAQVSVCDTGLGIPPEEQGIIFDEFRQSERSAARGYGGMGLGLAISRRLVELHGGRIGVQSSGREGAGSTFSFTLPVLGKDKPIQPVSGKKILLLAWHVGGSLPLQERLIQQGFEVDLLLVGNDPDWAVRVVETLPAAVVLDSELAAGQGWEILKALKDHPVTRQIPVLFCSLLEENGRGSLLELDYLMKPLAQADLSRVFSQQGLLSDNANRTILVVDDEPGTLAMNVRMVRSLSPQYEVLTACNGCEALEAIRRSLPDMVLLDLMMPEMDGFEVLEAMRAGETTRDIPVVVLTAQVLTESDMERLNRGVAVVLGKGIYSLEEILAHVQGTLERQQKLGSETQRLVRKAMAYLHTHYAEQISLEALANHIGVHKNYLIRCFRQETGLTPFAYLTRYRINRAKTLLAVGDKSVGEVAEAVGFSDISYFSRAFQKEAAVSPGAYRRGQRTDKPSV